MIWSEPSAMSFAVVTSLGQKQFHAALKLYAVNPQKDLNKLSGYAKKMRVANVLRQYLEVLL